MPDIPFGTDYPDAPWPDGTGGDDHHQGERSKSSEDVDPEDSSGHGVLDAVERFLARFVVYPSVHERRAHVLWIAHTWLMDCWESTPRIAFLSPEPGSGKSRALEVTEPLVPRPVHAVNTSPAYLFRKVSDPEGPPTILYDEIDTVFGPRAKDNEDIRGMLNAGHRKGATAGRCVVRGKIVETEELPAYCAVALAGLDDLPDTIMSRAVVVRMRRRAPGEKVEPWRLRINGPEAAALKVRLATWSARVAAELAAEPVWPEMPEGIEDRNADVWEALLAVADMAGGRWPADARASAVTVVTASRQSRPSLGVQLLADVRTVFADICGEKLLTEQLIKALCDMDEAPWRTIRRGEPLDARGLSTRLAKYGIGSKPQRDGESVFKGYNRDQFADAWSRYLPPPPSPPVSVTSVTQPPAASPHLSVTAVTAVTEHSTDAVVTAVTDESAPTGECACGELLIHSESLARGRCAECARCDLTDPEGLFV